jgi:nondiscriminating aspartyl-tRNA synthetase
VGYNKKEITGGFMERTLALESLQKIGETILLKGWVDVKRDHGKIGFIDLRDRSAKIQIFMTGEQIAPLHTEDVVYITGKVQKRPEKLINPHLSTGTVEIVADNIEIISKAAELPFDIGKDNLDPDLPTMLDYRSLVLRHPKIQAIFRVQAVVIDAFRRALLAKDFLEFQAPSIISSVPEGGAEVFKVKYFEHDAYLSQSPQLYKSLLVGAFERVFSVNQIFRAEPSVTTRHLTEATSLDAEFGFIDSWEDVLNLQEYVVKSIFKAVKENCSQELDMYHASLPAVSEKIPVVKLREAQEIIFARTGRDNRQEKDLSPEDEREICAYAKEKFGSELIFISHFISAKKPFYVYPDPQDPTYAFSVDLLGRGVEWSSGGQRLHDYQEILDHVEKWGLKPADIELYLQSFRYGVPPLGGFALGAERMTMHILGLKNIREASLFPRDMERIDTRFSVSTKIAHQPKGSTVYEKIVSTLADSKIEYQHFEHEPVFTSEASAKVRGTSVHQGAKALVLQQDKEYILMVLPADQRADLDQLKNFLNAKRLAMASKESVQNKTGLDVGAIPPFGSIMGLKTYLDPRLADNQEIAFNAGRHDRSIKMSYQDFLKVEKPELIKLE